jgi:hypothetical protein
MLRWTIRLTLVLAALRFIYNGMKRVALANKFLAKSEGPRFGDKGEHWLLGSLPLLEDNRHRGHDYRVDTNQKYGCHTWVPNPPQGFAFLFGSTVGRRGGGGRGGGQGLLDDH